MKINKKITLTLMICSLLSQPNIFSNEEIDLEIEEIDESDEMNESTDESPVEVPKAQDIIKKTIPQDVINIIEKTVAKNLNEELCQTRKNHDQNTINHISQQITHKIID